jgi:hypothetical protein
MMREHYVYAHRRASDGRLFYIGKGRRRRAWSSCGRSRHWRHVVKKHGFTVHILTSELSEAAALSLEQFVIMQIGLANLTNATLGGGGIQGWRHSEETKRRIGEASRRQKRTAKQLAALKIKQTFSLEYRARMSEAAKNRKRAPHSAETRAKISASHIGIRPSAETLEKMRLSHLGKCGRESPSYDHTIRRFAHPDHGEFVGTRGDLIVGYGLPSSCMSALLKGKKKSVKGWVLL